MPNAARLLEKGGGNGKVISLESLYLLAARSDHPNFGGRPPSDATPLPLLFVPWLTGTRLVYYDDENTRSVVVG